MNQLTRTGDLKEKDQRSDWVLQIRVKVQTVYKLEVKGRIGYYRLEKVRLGTTDQGSKFRLGSTDRSRSNMDTVDKEKTCQYMSKKLMLYVV